MTPPIQEVFVLSWGGPDEPIKTLERDSVGAWWLRHGGEVVRRATPDEVEKAKDDYEGWR